MLREELGLALHQLGEAGFKRFGDLRMQMLPGDAQQAAMHRVLHQGMIEAVERLDWRAYLKKQLGGHKAGESGLQLIFGKRGDGTQQRIRKLTSYRRAYLSHKPHRRRAVEPRHQRRMQTRRDRECWQCAV